MAPIFGVGTDAVFSGPVTSIQHDTKLTWAVAEKSLDTIADVLECFEEEQSGTSNRKRKSSSLSERRAAVWIIRLLFWLGLAASAAVIFFRDVDDLLDCKYTLSRCSQPDAAPDTACSDLPTLTIQNFSRDPAQACAMSRVVRVYNLALWRWMLMALLYWPLHIIAHVFARIVATVVSSLALTKHVLLFSVGLHKQVGNVIGAAAWLGIWFPISAVARSWARHAPTWRVEAGRDVWSDDFLRVHRLIWRLLLVYLIFRIFELAAAAASKWLALQFHDKNHFERMQTSLVHEHVLQRMSMPQRLESNMIISLGDHTVALEGYGPAHWQALRFVTSLVNENDAIYSTLDPSDVEHRVSVRRKAKQLQIRLAKLMCDEQMLQHRASMVSLSPTVLSGIANPPPISEGGELSEAASASMPGGGSIPDAAADGALTATAGRPAAPMPGLTLRRTGSATSAMRRASAFVTDRQRAHQYTSSTVHENAIYRDTLPDAACSDFASAAAPTNAQALPGRRSAGGPDEVVEPEELIEAASLTPEDKPIAGWEAVRSSLRTASTTSLLVGRPVRPFNKKVVNYEDLEEEASEALAALKGQSRSAQPLHRRRRRGTRSDWMVQQLAAARPEVKPKKLNVGQLHAHLMGNSFMKVLVTKESDSKEMTSKMSARKLGYYIFWNLRSCGVAVTSHDVGEIAARSGLRYKETACKLFDRNGDSFITIEEVIASVEAVYENRKHLTRSIKDSHTVVEQVESAIWISLMIVLIFLAIGIFDRNAVRDTWTAMSAGLLSVTFIIGNSIRQLFENTVYLFFVHAFDVGDTIQIHDTRFDVRSITLQYILLSRVDGPSFTMPTSELRTVNVHNMSRSGLQWKGIQFAVDQDKITKAEVEICAGEVVAAMKLHPKCFGGEYAIFLSSVLRGYKLELSCWYSLSDPGIDLILRHQSTMLVVEAIRNGLNKAGVKYTVPPLSAARQGDAATRLPPLYPFPQDEYATNQPVAHPGGRVASQNLAQAAAANMVLLS